MYIRRLMVLKWKDKKDVLMLSTFHNDNTKKIEDQNTRKINPSFAVITITQWGVSNTVTVFYCRIPASEND